MKLSKDAKLLRLISARFDMSQCLEAFKFLEMLPEDDQRFGHFAVSMAVSYGRPFYENKGLGTLKVDYPDFPDFSDREMNMRHHRLIDLRNRFMAHSSCEGTKVLIIPPKTVNPESGEVTERFEHLVGKRTFGDIRFYDWLKDVAYELKGRLDHDVRERIAEIGRDLADPTEMETGYDEFVWSNPSPIG